MPLDLASLLRREAEVAVPYAGDVIRVVYRPEMVTAAYRREVTAAGEDWGLLFAALERVVIGWDLTEDGRPFPPTAANLERLGFGLIAAVLGAIGEDVQNPTWRATGPTPSSNGSSPTASSAAPPTTPSPSSPPAGPASPPGPSSAPTTPAPAWPGVPG